MSQSKKSKKILRKKLLFSLSAIIFLAIIITVCIVLRVSYEPLLSDMETHYDSLSLRVDFKGSDCDLYEYQSIKIDNKNGIAYFDNVLSSSIEESRIRRYFLRNEKNYDKLYYQKYLAGQWQYNSLPSNFKYPNERLNEVLEDIKKSSGDKLSIDNDMIVYGISDFIDGKKIYEHVNSIAALGNDYGSDLYASMKAKVYLQKNRRISKIIFYPKSLPKQAMSDVIGKCKEVTWSFSDINKTVINYKDELWEYF